MRKLLLVVTVQIFWYFLWAFVTWDINFFPTIDDVRAAYAFFWVIILVISSFPFFMDERDLPEFLRTPTHEEKKSSIKKYIGELHEELALYWEAMWLQKKIRDFQSKK